MRKYTRAILRVVILGALVAAVSIGATSFAPSTQHATEFGPSEAHASTPFDRWTTRRLLARTRNEPLRGFVVELLERFGIDGLKRTFERWGINPCYADAAGGGAAGGLYVALTCSQPAGDLPYTRWHIAVQSAALRQGPGTNYSVIRYVGAGTPIDVVCQSTGTVYDGSNIWNRLTGGEWVHDALTTSPNYNAYSTRAC
jgi:hypothetical protein